MSDNTRFSTDGHQPIIFGDGKCPFHPGDPDPHDASIVFSESGVPYYNVEHLMHRLTEIGNDVMQRALVAALTGNEQEADEASESLPGLGMVLELLIGMVEHFRGEFDRFTAESIFALDTVDPH